MTLGSDQPFRVTAVAFHDTSGLAGMQKVGVSAWKRHRIEGVARGASPLPMPLLPELAQSIVERGEDFDQHVIAAKSKGRCGLRHTRRGTLEFVGEHRATR